MSVNFAHLHLLLNHFPIIGTIVGLGLFLASFAGKNDDLRRSSFIIFAAVGLLAIATFVTGFGAQAIIKDGPGVPNALIQRHEGAAMLSVWFVEATGVFAAIGLWKSRRNSRPPSWNVLAVLVFSLLAVGLIARTGNTGGEISHPEVRDSQAATVTEGPVGSFVRVFEPSPEKFTFAMIGNKWFWWFLMALHFIGLALIVGTVGVLDIRIMGFLKQLPIGPLLRLIPWAMLGLGVNVVTGQLAFIGQPESYVTSIAFWLKMLSLLLLGLNAAAFYLTGIFDRVEPLTAGEDAPMSAKLVAASGLFLWFAMITFGRYIQLFTNN
jgi:uncharacterized membrane protein